LRRRLTHRTFSREQQIVAPSQPCDSLLLSSGVLGHRPAVGTTAWADHRWRRSSRAASLASFTPSSLSSPGGNRTIVRAASGRLVRGPARAPHSEGGLVRHADRSPRRSVGLGLFP